MCGSGYCQPHGSHSSKDEAVYLEEYEKILEAKLATVRHLKEEASKKQVEKK